MRSTTRRAVAVCLAGAALALLAVACSGGDEEPAKVCGATPAGQYLPVVISSDLSLGPSRFLLGLIDQTSSKEVVGAQLRLRFFKCENGGRTFKIEIDPKPIQATKSFTHEHPDGHVETHEAGETGAYVAELGFDNTGDWEVEVEGSVNGVPLQPVSAGFPVAAESLSPAVGNPAPATKQPVLGDPGIEISDIDTSYPPIPGMHDMTVAAALTSGKPSVIIFATPMFCTSRICGPTKLLVDQLYEKYKGKANFIHIEPYDLDMARSGQALDPLPFVTQEWGLQAEPWVFFVDKDGAIAAKFQALVSYEDLEGALQPLLKTAG